MLTLVKKANIIFNREGLVGFLKLLLIRFNALFKLVSYRLILFPIAFPLAAILIFISPFIRIRLLMLPSSRIGQYAIDTEVMLRAESLSADQQQWKTFFYTAPRQPICNTQIHRMFKRVIPILPFPRLIAEIDRYLFVLGKKKYRADAFKNFFDPRIGDGRDRWNLLAMPKRYLNFTAAEDQQGKILLKKLGVPADAKFVCLLVRDSNYLNVYLPKGNWAYHNYRDASIENYAAAAQYLADQGFYVLRMGKHVKDKFNINHPNVIDYANSQFRSDFMDVYLSANCYFFMSSSTGIDSIAKVFQRPLLITNLPVFTLDIWIHAKTLFIPKKIIDTERHQVLTFKETYQLFSDAYRKNLTMTVAEEKKLLFIENTPEENVAAVIEMLNRLSGNDKDSEEDHDLQARFWRDFPVDSSGDLPGLKVPAYRSGSNQIRIVKTFLKENVNLLD